MAPPTSLIENSRTVNSSFDDDFEEIGTIKYGDAPEPHQDVRTRGFTSNEESETSNASKVLVERTSDRSKTVNQPKYDQSVSENIATASHQPNPKRFRVKSLSLNGATLQELQTKRIENRALSERQKLLQNQLRSVPLTPAKKIEGSFSRNNTTMARDEKRCLPSVKDATKQKLLMLNRRYNSSKNITGRISLARPAKSYEVYHQIEAQDMSMQTKQCIAGAHAEHETSPFKLIMQGIRSHDTTSQTTNVVTPDDKLGSAAFSDGDYLFHLTQLAQGSASLHEDDEASSSKQSSCSSYASPAPHCQTESVCDSQASDDDNGCSSCSKMRSEIANTNTVLEVSKTKLELTRALHTLLQNRRLRHALSFIKHAMIILSLALLFAWVDFAKEKTMHWLHNNLQLTLSLLANCVQCVRDSAIRWFHSIVQFVTLSLSEWLQSTQVTLTNCYHSSVQWMLSSVSAWKELVHNEMSHWYQHFIQRILILILSVTQRSSLHIRTTKELFLNLTSAGKDRICDLDQLSQIKLFTRTKQVSKLIWHGLGMIYYDLAGNIDVTSTLMQTWFLSRKLQLDWSLALSDTTQKIVDMIETASVTLNSTIEFVSSEWQELASQSMTGDGGQVFLTKSTITVPFPFESSRIVSWHNLTLGLERSEAMIDHDPSFVYLSASLHMNNLERSRNIPKFHSFGLDRARNVFLHNYYNPLSTLQGKQQENSESSLVLMSQDQNQFKADYGRDYLQPSSKDDARRYYDASFPTFPAVLGGNEDRDGFDSVNLMEMASEATKRLISRRIKSK